MIIKPDINPYSASKACMDSGHASLEIIMIYLDFVLSKDDYHQVIMDTLFNAGELLKAPRVGPFTHIRSE